MQELLLNLLWVLLPIFLYQSLWGDKAPAVFRLRNRTSILFLSAASIVLCMSFPVTAASGFLLDLRLIPFLIGVFYGGPQVGAVLLLLVLGYRYVLGGPGFVLACITFPLAFAAAVACIPQFRGHTRMQKLHLLLLLCLAETLLSVGSLLWLMHKPLLANPQTPLLIAFALLHLFTAWVALMLAEGISEKHKLRQEIRRSEKVHMLGELTASIAHEIRNPLTVVHGFLQLLDEQEDALPPEKRLLYLKMGIDELDRAETIITNYLNFARPKQMTTVDISERIAQVCDIISSFAMLRNVEIEKRAEDGLHIHGDPEKIAQVLMNLLKNGIEAMPAGGTLSIAANKQGKQVVIAVRDTGVGMSAEETQRLGDPFYSTKEQGTGLGLLVCYQIIRSMNGSIHVNSEPNKGTQFRIHFPAAT